FQQRGGRLLTGSRRFWLPAAHLDAGAPVTALDSQCRHGAHVGAKTFGQARPKPPDQFTQPQQVNTVPTSFIFPIMERHGVVSSSLVSTGRAPVTHPSRMDVTRPCSPRQGAER